MKASNKVIDYEDIFQLNYEYYLKCDDESKLDNINYYINPLLGAVAKIRFDNSKGFMKGYLGRLVKSNVHRGVAQIVLDYLYDNTTRWERFQFVVPTVTLSIKDIENIKIDVEDWCSNMKKAILEKNEEEARELHKRLTLAMLNVEPGFDFNYRIREVGGKEILLDFPHLIAHSSKTKKTIDLLELLDDESWRLDNLITEAVIQGI